MFLTNKSIVFFFQNSNSQLSKIFRLSYNHSSIENSPSGLPFACSRFGVLFPICSKTATDLLPNFLYISAKNRFLSKWKISTLKDISAILLHGSRIGVLFLICSKIATDLQDNFHIFLAKSPFFFQKQKFQFSKLVQLSHHHGSKEEPLDYNLHIVGFDSFKANFLNTILL